MTVQELIIQCNQIRANSFTDEQKTVWIRELEQRLQDLHALVPKENELQIEAPYQKLYILYMLAQMEFYNFNIVSYNQLIEAFNTELASYTKHCLLQYKFANPSIQHTK
ncbi:MAG: hypothetical protein SPL05_07385 [Eubacteriales bacterium]|nr:hypothetical protein [Eubacteriales bacterium]